MAPDLLRVEFHIVLESDPARIDIKMTRGPSRDIDMVIREDASPEFDRNMGCDGSPNLSRIRCGVRSAPLMTRSGSMFSGSRGMSDGPGVTKWSDP